MAASPIIRAAEMGLTDNVVARAAGRFGIKGVESIGGFENALYRSIDPPGRILRLTHSTRRSAPMIEAEFAFMGHLARSGVAVVSPVPSNADRLVEEVDTDDDDMVIAACMTEAPGEFRRPPEWADSEIESYGALLGSMHEAAGSYVATASARRPPWTDPIFDVGLGGVEKTHPELFVRSQEITAAAAVHPAGGEGLAIHQDAHLGNLFITDGGEITIFDFDDSAYGTPTHDVAIVMFYWLLGREGDLGPATRRFVKTFMRGYERHARLRADWPVGADLFLSYREIDIYWLLHDEPDEDCSPGELRFMEGRRERILEGVPCLDKPLADIL